jgi:hypothetical protein
MDANSIFGTIMDSQLSLLYLMIFIPMAYSNVNHYEFQPNHLTLIISDDIYSNGLQQCEPL